MLNKTDLANAVSEGIISADQAKQLETYAKRVRSNDDTMAAYDPETRDEPFRLLRGFRDFFIAIGVVFLSVGATAIIPWLFGFSDFLNQPIIRSGKSSDFLMGILASLVLVVMGIVLSEVITRKLRLPLSSLVLSMAIALWFGTLGFNLVGLSGLYQFFEGRAAGAAAMIAMFLSAFTGVAILYYRYRLPFLVLVIAITLASFLAAVVYFFAPYFVEHNRRVIIGFLGFAIFIAAMAFDIKDRLRVTRFSECGFWLHLVAAPMMVHSALGITRIGQIDPVVIFAAFGLLTFVALVIDRRAILVSSLIYLSYAFYQLIKDLDLENGLQTFIPLGAIGLVVVLLGVGWSPLRRVVLNLLPLPKLKMRLPPIAGSA